MNSLPPAQPALPVPNRRDPSTNARQLALAFGFSLLMLSSAGSAFAQNAPQPDDKGPAKANWTLANRFSTAVLREFTYTQALVPHFLGKTDSLWYNWKDRNGARFVLMVPTLTGVAKKPLFDAAKVAEALTIARKKPYDANNLPFTTLTFLKDHKAFRFSVDTSRYEWSLVTETLKSLGRNPRTPPNDEEIEFGSTTVAGRGIAGSGRDTNSFKNFSPDSTAFAFARHHNVYVVEVGKNETTQVTTSGVEDWSFGNKDTTENRRQQDALNGVNGVDSSLVTRADSLAFKNEMRVRANVEWSPDSKAFSTQRQDMRQVKELYLVNVLAEPRPVLLHYKYAMPGEENVGQSELWVYRRGDKAAKQLNVAKWKDQRFLDIHWPVSGDKVRLVRRDRTQRNLDFIEVDVATGAVKTLLTDAIEDAALEPKNVSYLKKGGDFLWWSQKSGWGMYYIYDFNGGAAKRQLTTGSWNVERVARIDSLTGTVWVFGEGREPGEQLYQTHTYRVNGDGTGLAIVDAGDASHTTTISPTKKYAYDTYSRMDQPPRSILRDAMTGKIITTIEEMDLSKLKELGFRNAEPYTVKAADGITDLYGNIFKPFDFDSTKKYPLIAYVYPGPQTEAVTTGFSIGGQQMQLAQLGFIVIEIGHRGGTPLRSLAYHRYGYYNMRDYALADKKSGIEQLAARHKWIDIDKVGIFGHSGGGFLTAAAMMLPPYNEFFKVGWSESGNHDNNIYNQNWSEWNHGVRIVSKSDTARARANAGGARGGPAPAGNVNIVEDSTNTDSIRFAIRVPTNEELAGNLRGNLALTTGDLDNNVHPGNTIRMVNALIKANKRFDLFVYPGEPHGYRGTSAYNQRMLFEYFSEHLLGDYYKMGGEIKP